MKTLRSLILLAAVGVPGTAAAAGLEDLWTPQVIAKIRDQSTLAPVLVPRATITEVFFDSEIGDANWGDTAAPYDLHTGDTIHIHGYLAAPRAGGPYPAIVVGHGHHGSADADLARVIAAFGYVVLSISGPRAGLSTGGPEDTEQAWITVEPAPNYSYLYHYIYAGMRALTLMEHLAAQPGNPYRIDPTRLGVMGASMGGQFTYCINGIDDRVRAAVAVAVAGDWAPTLHYEGSWLYHGLYYYTRDGLQSGVDAPNAVADVCTDQTLHTFKEHFDPASYAPTQHAPLLTVIGSHDQYFPLPAINTTYNKVASAGTDPGFAKRLTIVPNGKHGVVDNGSALGAILSVIATVNAWLRYAFDDGPAPPAHPTLYRLVTGDRIVFAVPAAPGAIPISGVFLNYATQIDTTPQPACDFERVRMWRFGNAYYASVPLGATPSCGPPVTAENVIYFASVNDWGGFSVSSTVHRGSSEMTFTPDFAPVLEHFPRDLYPVPPPPDRCTP